MRTEHIGTEAEWTSVVASDLEPAMFRSIREILPDRTILDACIQAGYRFRRRTLTPVLTVLHMVFTALWPAESFAAAWRQLWVQAVGRDSALAGRSPTAGARAKARRRLPMEVWRRLFDAVVAALEPLCERWARWRGHRVVLVDGTCVSMSDTPSLMDAFGANTGPDGRGRYPLLRPLLANLLPGDLLIGDRHFAGAHLYVRYLEAGLAFLTRAHQCLKVSKLRRIETYSAHDSIAAMPVGKKYRREDPSLPKQVPVRMLCATLRIRGRRQRVWFATSLLDAGRYPAADVLALYARRWRIETLLEELKIGLSADVLRSQTPDGVRKEIAARLLALNAVRHAMLQAAAAHGVDPLRQSFIGAVDVLLAFGPVIATASPRRLPGLRAAMLREISSRLNPLRPDRLEPRAIRREVKHYPALKITRAQWRKEHAA